jgi:hypothetical protein
MSVIRQFTNTALSLSDTVLTLSTGSFEVNGEVLFPEQTIIDLQDQAHSSTSFPDSTQYGNDFSINPGGTGTIAWDNSTAAEGTTSIKTTGKKIECTVVQLVSGDFDIEFHIKGTYTDSYASFFQIVNINATILGGFTSTIIIGHSNTYSTGTSPVKATIQGVSGTLTITGTTDVKDNVWHQINLKRVSGVLSLEVDTVSEGTPVAYTDKLTIERTVGSLTYTPNIAMTLGHINGVVGSTLYIDRFKFKRTPQIFDSQPYYYFALGE